MIQIVVDVLGTVPKTLKNYLENWRSVEESRTFRSQHSLNQLEYLEESWRREETCCHSAFSEKPLIKTRGKS